MNDIELLLFIFVLTMMRWVFVYHFSLRFTIRRIAMFCENENQFYKSVEKHRKLSKVDKNQISENDIRLDLSINDVIGELIFQLSVFVFWHIGIVALIIYLGESST